MPEAPLRDPRTVTSLDEAEVVLREAGGRVTTSRRAILKVLFDADGPWSTDAIAAAAEPPLDLPATYRNLEHLEDLGLVRHVHLGHGAGLYELVSGEEHEYALCESCGSAISFAPEKLDALRDKVDDAIGYRPRFTHFPLVGRCRRCR